MKSETSSIKQRYDRIAPYFDAMEGMMEKLLFGTWRQRIWSRVEPGKVLEAGVGTGKNFPYYPATAEITAIDFSAKMLNRARRKAEKQKLRADLRLMDVERLDFPDHSFDTAIATFVFCSVPSPVQGLQELHRVLKPGGRLLLLEHVLSAKPWLAALMNLCNPLVVAAMGANINRDTVQNVRLAGFDEVHVDAASGDIIKLIEARKPF
jgi:phosphatidylethanolamine/phosphatidyl-N-methylethanolamine N-methyltransferase